MVHLRRVESRSALESGEWRGEEKPPKRTLCPKKTILDETLNSFIYK